MMSCSDETPFAKRAFPALWMAAVCLGAAPASLLACSGPSDKDIVVGHFPSAMTFAPVSAPLEKRCGTLDCHGSSYRNLRVFGKDGLRAGKNDVSGIQDTTEEERQLNYESLVSIEPEKLSGIVDKAGQGFDKWIVITKGTGAEHHKGANRFAKGDATYVCLQSWVTGAVNMNACADGANLPGDPAGAPPPDGTDPSGGMPPDGTPPQP